MIKITNHATINTYLQLDNEIQPIVKEISKIRNYSMAEICEKETIRKTLSKFIAALDYFKKISFAL